MSQMHPQERIAAFYAFLIHGNSKLISQRHKARMQADRAGLLTPFGQLKPAFNELAEDLFYTFEEMDEREHG